MYFSQRLKYGELMIKINVVAVGKVKEKYFTEGINEYSKRLGRFCDFKIIEVQEENYSKCSDSIISEIKKKEGERIKQALRGYVVCMSIDGIKISSEGLSKKIDELSSAGVSEITFVIGGSYGLDEGVLSMANLKLSFSDMTFPHTLFRLMLTEQLYRAFSISANTSYHK